MARGVGAALAHAAPVGTDVCRKRRQVSPKESEFPGGLVEGPAGITKMSTASKMVTQRRDPVAGTKEAVINRT